MANRLNKARKQFPAGLKIVAAIPAYNEAKHIAGIIKQAAAYVDEVIVADDGSSDDTARVASRAGARVIRSEVNRGAGQATRDCFTAARKAGAAILVTLDGDGQHNPKEIPLVLSPIIENTTDIVIGSRFLAANTVPRYRRFGINVITFLLNFGVKNKLTDSQSCFRAYNRKALESLDITEPGFSFSVELLINARRQGLRIAEVPISCIYNAASHSQNPVRHGLSVALSVIRLRLKRPVKRPEKAQAR